MKCISAYVYTSSLGNCSNGGISARFKSVLVAHKDGYIDPAKDERPVVKIRSNRFGGRDPFVFVPDFDPDKGCIGWMMGGSFVYSNDSRFPFDCPIPLYDRQETRE